MPADGAAVTLRNGCGVSTTSLSFGGADGEPGETARKFACAVQPRDARVAFRAANGA